MYVNSVLLIYPFPLYSLVSINLLSISVTLFYLFLNFTLQYYIGFAIHQHESAMGIHVFPILNPLQSPSPCHPSGSSQCTSPKHLVSCIKPRLVIHFLYDIIHVSMPFSQSSHPLPLLQSPKDCSIYICVSFTILHTGLLLPSF